VPIFVICRDKLTPLLELLAWLEDAGYRRVYLVDNASTYPPLVEFLAQTHHEVIRREDNVGPYESVWGAGLVTDLAASEYYVVTDSDIVPDPECPPDAVDYFHCLLQRYPGYAKAGFSLRIDNLPEHYALKPEVMSWEGQWWWRPLERGVFHAPIDTTFALYRPASAFTLAPSIRAGQPYWARHLPWYEVSDRPTAEQLYYRSHALPGIAHWDQQGQHRSAPAARMPLRERLLWPLHARFKVSRDVSVDCRGK